MFGKKIYSSNLGDSRTILVRSEKALGKYPPAKELDCKAITLTRDHKPTNEGERKRILQAGGRICPYKDKHGVELGPPRIWLKCEDVPGLAMSRSFGDAKAKTIGCLSTPDIKEFNIHRADRIIISASDGIWEFLTNQEVADLVYPFYLKK